MTIRVALADDQQLVREALATLLRAANFEVVLESNSGDQILQEISTLPIDVIVSDVRMAGMDGICLTRELRARGVQTPVVLLTTFDDADQFLAASTAGAQAYLLKDSSAVELRDAIQRAYRGEQILTPIASAPIRARYAYADKDQLQGSFGERELSILRLLAGGYSNKEIARTLFLADGTVKNYVSEILAKLGTRDRTRAVLKAITLKVI